MIVIVMTTYFPTGEIGIARKGYACECIDSFWKLSASEPIRIHLADDGSDEKHISFVERHAAVRCEYFETFNTISSGKRSGIGASLNRALEQIGNDDLWLYTTDDWYLTKELDLAGPVKLLRDRDYDLVRLGPIHPGLHCIVRFEENLGWWLDLQQHYGGFAFGTRPFIARKSLIDKVGNFDEYLNAYETERLYAERVAKSVVKLAYWGGVDLSGPWEHLGVVEVGREDIY